MPSDYNYFHYLLFAVEPEIFSGPYAYLQHALMEGVGLFGLTT